MSISRRDQVTQAHSDGGVSGQPRKFTQEVVECNGGDQRKADHLLRVEPDFASECTAKQAYEWSAEGRAVASGGRFRR